MTVLNRISKFTGIMSSGTIKESSVSISQKILSDSGFVNFSHGVGTIMPLLLRSLRKLEALVRREMKEISAMEFMLPILTSSDLFKVSGRENLSDLFKVPINKDRSYILSPTCEEAVTHILTSHRSLNYQNLPIRLYQICSKFRDEKRPRSGLLRANEFLMKDLYCFDADEESSEQCYQEVINRYHHLFKILNVPYVCVEGPTGDIGGLKSHEFHLPSNAGQDKIVLCKSCGHAANLEIAENKKIGGKCKKCESDITLTNGIEVGHAFKLGTRYTKPFEATYISEKQTHEILHMSSFGLGLTRILAACVEVLSKPNEIMWPVPIAPFLVCVLPPKAGSKEEAVANDTAQFIYQNLNQSFEDDVIMDDRTQHTIGKRIHSNKKIGFPFQVVLGKNLLSDPPAVEVIDSSSGSTDLVQIPDINQFILDKLSGDPKKQHFKEKLTL